MRILLSGGAKTQNIITGIGKKFSASGDDFLVIEYLDNIPELFGRGEYFDKAVITEQSITREYTITDEYEIRNRINKFANEMASKPKKYNYVFLTQTEEIANMIHEEILPILNESAVVLKKPPYEVVFFVSLITTDVKQLPSDIVYTPELEIPDDIDLGFDNEDMLGDMDTDETFVGKVATDMDAEMFGFDNTVKNSEKVSDEVEIFAGEYNKDMETEDDFSFSNDFGTNNFGTDDFGADNFGEGEFVGDNTSFSGGEETDWSGDASDWMMEETPEDKFSADETLDIMGDEPIKQSGELPNYVQENEIPVNTTVDTGYIKGFDEYETDSDESMNFGYTEPDNFGSDMYTPQETKAPYELSKASGMNGEEAQNNSFNQGFGADDYDNSDSFGTDGIDISQGTPQFDINDYSNSDTTNEDYQNSIDNSIYASDPTEFNPADYQQESDEIGNNNFNTGNNNMQSNQQNQLVSVQKGKRGLLGKLRGKPNEQVATPEQRNPANIGIGGNSRSRINIDKIKEELKPFANRGNSIVVTGCGGCGTSTVAYNLANIVAQLGYTVLLVDMDTEGRTQSYISKDNYESMEPDGANLMSAVNSSNGINTHISVVRTGFHLLTMGLGTDTAPVSELIHKEKLSRFVNLSKTSHNFVIYDIPFKDATGFLSELTYMTDNLVLVTDASNWGITKTMLSMCNIASDDMQDTMFTRSQLVFNRYRNLYRVLGKKVKNCVDITKVMDQKVLELVGDDPGFHFEELHIAGIINDDPDFENGWFEETQYTDTKKGQEIFLELIEHIVLKK